MCFSSAASFIATATLGTLGVVAIKKAEPSQRLIAFIPFLFAIQQLSEGIEWLSFHGQIGEQWLTPGKYVFLFFAQVLWPGWLPFAVYMSETDPSRKKFILLIVILGLGLAIYHTYCLLTYKVSVETSEHHVLYRLEYLHMGKTITNTVYFITAVIPPFLSSNRRLQLVGLLNLVTLAIAFFMYREYLLSVWCYFAALISAGILWAIYPSGEQHEGFKNNSRKTQRFSG